MDIITYALAHKAKVALTSPKDGVPGKVLISDGQGGTTWGEHINILVVKASENSAFNSTADTITVTSIKDNKGKTWDKSSTHIGDTVYVEEQKLPDRWISKIEGSTIYLAKLETIQVPVVGVTVNDTSVVDTSTGIANIVVDDTLSAASENAIANKAVYVETQAIRAYATQAIADEFTRAANNENRIEGVLNSEITRAKTAEEANTALINSEVANRKVADTTLQQNIDAEKTRATTVENAINQNLAQSVANLSQIDAALQVNIANEKIRAEGVEATLQSNITAEHDERVAADGLLQQNIEAEATAARAAEKTNADNITAEKTRAKAAEKTNADAIEAEATRAADAENLINNNLAAEVQTRLDSDLALDAKIGKITYAHEPELSEDKKMFFANGCPVKIINKGAELYAQYMIDNAAVANNSTGPINYKEMKITGVSHIYAGGNGKDKNVYYPATMLIIDVNTTEYTTKTAGDYAFKIVSGGCLGSGTVGSATVIVENGSLRGLYAGSSKELSNGTNVSYDDACFTGEAKVILNGGSINVMAANMDTTSTGHAVYEINGGSVNWLYSASTNGMTGVVDVIINGGSIGNALSVVRGTSEEANWTVNGGTVSKLYMSSDNDPVDWGNIKKVTLKALGGTITTLDKGGAANPVRSGSYKEGVITNLTSELATACNLTKIADVEAIAKSYTDTRIGDIGDNTNVKAYVDGKIGFLADNLDPDAIDSIKEVVDLVQGEGVIGQININKTDIAKITYAHKPVYDEAKKTLFANGVPVKIIEKSGALVAQYLVKDENGSPDYLSTGVKYVELAIPDCKYIYGAGNGLEKNTYYPATMIIVDAPNTEFRRVCGGAFVSGSVGTSTVIINNIKSAAGVYVGGGKEYWNNGVKTTAPSSAIDDANFVGEGKLIFNGGTVTVAAASLDLTTVGHSEIEVNAGTVDYLYAAGANGMSGVTDVVINGGTVNNAFSAVRANSEEANWTVNGGSVGKLYMASDYTEDATDNGTVNKVTLKALGGEITELKAGSLVGGKVPVRSGSYKAGVIKNDIPTACNLSEIIDTDTKYAGSDSIEITGDNNSISIKDGGVIEDKLSQEVKDKLNAACAEYTVIKADDTSTKPTANIYQLTKDDVQVGVDVKDTLYYDDNLTTRIIGNNQVQVQTTDDAARSQWGGGWRMPTYDELDELWNMSWNFTEDSSVGSGGRPGYVTISGNGNSIKLPTTDKKGDTISDGFWYVSSDLYDSIQAKCKNAYCQLYKGGTTTFHKYLSTTLKYTGMSIRPVLDKGADANGHIAVDIGLSVLWADRNLGADDFKDVGHKIAWGETEPKAEYTFGNYKYADTINGSAESVKYTKYVVDATYGVVDNLTRLDQGTFYTKKEVDRLFASKISATYIGDNSTIEINNNVVSVKSGKFVETVDGSSLIADTEITRLAGIETGAQVNKIETVQVNGAALAITDKTVNIDISNKVDKDGDKQLSTNDYTNDEKTKLAGLTQYTVTIDID